MLVEPLPLSDALLVTVQAFADERGFFKEVYSEQRYRDRGVAVRFVQDNLSQSRRHVLRGLHGDPRMAKLVGVVTGRAFDAIADLRPASPTFMHWYGTELSEDDHRQLFVPAGFLHGFLALTDEVTLLYKQSAPYDPSTEFGVAWNDPDLAIAWPLGGAQPILSDKDAANPTLRASGRV